MIKITFEFEDVREAVTFLQNGQLAKTNVKVGILPDVKQLEK